MKQLRKTLVGITTIVALGVTALTGCSFGKYVVKVNGEKISVKEFNKYLNSVQVTMQLQEGKNDIWDKKDEKGKSYKDLAKESAVEMAITQAVQMQKAKELKIELTKTDLQDVQKKYDEYIKQTPDTEKKLGVTKEQLLDLLKDMALLSKLEESYTTKEFDKVYPEYIKVSHILISTVDANNKALSKEKQDAAKKKAEDILKKVQAGEDFAKLAETYGQDPGLKTKGYYVFGKGQMVQEFETAAYGLKEGATSGLVKTSYGYHIIKRLPFSAADREKEKAELVKQYIQQEQYKQYYGMPSVYQTAVQEWRKAAKVEKNDEVIKSIEVKTINIEQPAKDSTGQSGTTDQSGTTTKK